MIIPTNRLFIALGIVAAIALLVSLIPDMASLWLIALFTALALIILDTLLVYRSPQLRASRNVSSSLPLGVKRSVSIRIYNDSSRDCQVSAFDHHPLTMHTEGLPIDLHIPRDRYAEFTYLIQANKRGKMVFPYVQVHLFSPIQLWKRNVLLESQSEVHVYPNFAAVSHYALMATDNRLSQMGIIKKRRRGEGQDFHQLREYRQGDSLRQIDWKASSRMRKVISREYQDERDQEVIFLLDCGHRMQAKDGELSHFDHTLNAILLLSYVALRQGDAVGLVTFGGATRWSPPRKGQHIIQQILNTVYDLEPTAESPDYSRVATELMLRQKKRALVILISNLRDEDADDILPALKLMRKRHLVMLASMREQAIDDVMAKPIEDHEDAVLMSATHHYMQYRKKAFDKINNINVLNMDVTPSHLTVNLINHYLTLKRSGIL